MFDPYSNFGGGYAANETAANRRVKKMFGMGQNTTADTFGNGAHQTDPMSYTADGGPTRLPPINSPMGGGITAAQATSPSRVGMSAWEKGADVVRRSGARGGMADMMLGLGQMAQQKRTGVAA